MISFFLYLGTKLSLCLNSFPFFPPISLCFSLFQTVDEEVGSGATPSPLDVRFYPDSQPSPFYENFDEVALSDPEEDTPSAQETRQGECPKSVLFAIGNRSLHSYAMWNSLAATTSCGIIIMSYSV